VKTAAVPDDEVLLFQRYLPGLLYTEPKNNNTKNNHSTGALKVLSHNRKVGLKNSNSLLIKRLSFFISMSKKKENRAITKSALAKKRCPANARQFLSISRLRHLSSNYKIFCLIRS
jgi:hypothetical protein